MLRRYINFIKSRRPLLIYFGSLVIVLVANGIHAFWPLLVNGFEWIRDLIAVLGLVIFWIGSIIFIKEMPNLSFSGPKTKLEPYLLAYKVAISVALFIITVQTLIWIWQ